MKIRLAMSVVIPIHTFEDEKGFRTMRFKQIGGNGSLFDIQEENILNMQEINMSAETAIIITTEGLSHRLFDSSVFTRDIELPH